MSRWKASAIHCSLSVILGLIVGSLLFGLWYPPPYFHAAGADELVLLLVGIDLTLGPLLTFVVFRSGKRGLAFDLACIGIVQTAALIYGLSVVLQSRPIFLVGVLDRFVLVCANEVTNEDLAKGSEPRFRVRSWTGPYLVAAEMPTNSTERSDLAFSALSGRDVQNLPQYYHDYSKVGKTLLTKAKSLEDLRKMRPQYSTLISDWLKRSGRLEASVAWLPLQTRKEDLVMLMDAGTAQPLQALAIDPW